MSTPKNPAPQLPAAITRYLEGAPPESRQFDFLVGEWRVDNTKYQPDGSVLMRYPGHWSVQSLNGGRLLVDNFKGFLPGGAEFVSVVTLGTWNPLSRRWDLVSLYAHEQPATVTEFHGEWIDGEMQLQARGHDAAGREFQSRMRYFNITPDRLEWELRVSLDGGLNWGRAATLVATRAAP